MYFVALHSFAFSTDPKDVKLALSKLAAKQEGSEGMSGRAPTPTIAEEGSGEGTEPTTLGYRCGGGGSGETLLHAIETPMKRDHVKNVISR